MQFPKLVANWRELLKKSWVNRVIYLMFAIQIFDILQKVAESQPVNMREGLLAILMPIGVWVRLLYQVALATSVMRVPPPRDNPFDKDPP